MERAPFSITVATESGVTAVAIAGEVDLNTTERLEEWTQRFRPVGPIELDLSEVTFINSTGIVALLRLRHLATEHGTTLTLVNPSPYILRVLIVTGLAEEFHIRSAVDGIIVDNTA